MTEPRQTPLTRLLPRHDKYNSKCVCEVCTCGMHHCPRGRSMGPKFQGQTTHQAFFTEKPLEGRRVFETPKATQTHYDQDVLKSSYKSQFTGLPAIRQPDDNGLGKSGVLGGSGVGERKRIPFYGETSYKSTYDKKEIELRPQPKMEYKPKDTKFEGSSSYKDAFQAPNAQQQNGTNSSKFGQLGASQSGQLGNSLSFNRKKIPFEGQSAYKQQFQKPAMDGPGGHRIPPAPQRPAPTKFQGESTYKQTYIKPDLGSQVKQHCPVLDMPRVPRQPSPGKQHLNYSSDKNVWQ